MTKRKAKNTTPAADLIEIAEWRRNKREVIRVRINKYRGRHLIDVRTWWPDTDGKYRPGPKGITLDIWHVRRLAKATKKAHAEAVNAGLVKK